MKMNDENFSVESARIKLSKMLQSFKGKWKPTSYVCVLFLYCPLVIISHSYFKPMVASDHLLLID